MMPHFRRNIIGLLAGAGLLLGQCQSQKIPAAATNLNTAFEISLNQKLALTGENQKVLGEIIFTQLDDSRCPANAMCVRQGAAVASFTIQAKGAEKQNLRLFIGDFMANDSRNKRNQTADTVMLQLENNGSYELILKAVMPYPGTSNGTPQATIQINKS
ncbi:hypothetical protein [Adhaeribacter rhizoryzae]|uniref:Uncharacterized protein n=1 Tax=Adhaeribacter rhizoryzae TaxID=2607907 RepID=A0A5M6D9C8_9BACT|nr:hypothetical protein [Adhaeribacter rhizoryzae]KAA5543963.1 hypothetical protein F0145_15395 [Adhaeribacter rhizoryzae]